MPCYHPRPAFQNTVTRQVKFSLDYYGLDRIGILQGIWKPISLPCGQCIGCRLERSRQWAVRCVLEASMHKENCFVTLTYNDDNLPPDLSLDKRVFQLFMKRLRKRVKVPIRFFACGEYGEKLQRPHYHVILFGIDLRKEEKECQHFSCLSSRFVLSSRSLLLSTNILSELWPYGFSSVGTCTFESAAYVARYCLKKVTGKAGKAFYEGRTPPFVLMSNRPGIAKPWYDKYCADVSQ